MSTLLMSAQEAGLVRNKKGYTDLATQKAGTIFTTSTLREQSEGYKMLQDKYSKQQNHLVKEIIKIAGMSVKFPRHPLTVSASYTPVLEQLDGLVAAVDVVIRSA